MGRTLKDSVTLAANSTVDNRVLAITYAYNPAGQLYTVTSWDTASPDTSDAASPEHRQPGPVRLRRLGQRLPDLAGG